MDNQPIVENSPESLANTNKEWTLSQERSFIEDLVHKRLTLFLAAVAFVVAGSIGLKDAPILRTLVLICGSIVCSGLAAATVRAHTKLGIILRQLNTDPTHPVAWTNTIAKPGSKFQFVGQFTPRFATFVLWVAVLALLWQIRASLV